MSSVKEQETVTIQAPRKKRRSRTQTLAVKSSGPTGPRTQRGKMKSRYNALKHGIFAKVVLRGSALRESKEDYENLLQSFREYFQPIGGLEEFKVEELAQLAWRKARGIRAEAAIIMKQTEFLAEERYHRLREASQGARFEMARLAGGIIRRKDNIFLLMRSLELLEALRELVARDGFDPERHRGLLETLYGELDSAQGIPFIYSLFSSRAKKAAKESPPDHQKIEECRKKFLEALDLEIERTSGEIRDAEDREEKKVPLLEESLAIPQDKELDRLLRYEARLDGAFDRTLQQLERLQRTRLGQPVAPAVKVDVTH